MSAVVKASWPLLQAGVTDSIVVALGRTSLALVFDNAISGPDWAIFRQNLATTLTPGITDSQSYALGDIDG